MSDVAKPQNWVPSPVALAAQKLRPVAALTNVVQLVTAVIGPTTAPSTALG